jgi:hypothetical protein
VSTISLSSIFRAGELREECLYELRPALRAASGRPPARQRHDGHRGAGLTLWPSRLPSPPGRTAVVLHHAEDALTPANARYFTDRAHGHRTRDGTDEASRVGGDHSHGARGAGVLWLDPGCGHRGRAGSAPSHWLTGGSSERRSAAAIADVGDSASAHLASPSGSIRGPLAWTSVNPDQTP